MHVRLPLAALLLLFLWSLLGCDQGAPERLNLVVISIDTMRADRLGRAGRDGLPLTPALDAQAERSRVFKRAYSPSNETLFSHAGIFLGDLPSSWGPLSYAAYRLSADAPTLAARLAQAGWRTEAVVAGGHLDPLFGLDAGFHHYFSTDSGFASFQETVPRALQRLDELATLDRPFFLFVHGYDCHSPYVKPGPLHHPETPGYDGVLVQLAANPLSWERIHDQALFPTFRPPDLRARDVDVLDPLVFDSLARWARQPGAERVDLDQADHDFVIGAYDSAVAYADSQVGRIFRRLDQLDLRRSTVVVVISDHGEDLLTHGFINHRVSLHDDNVAVVFMIEAPGLAPGEREDLVTLADLPAALLPLVGAGEGIAVDELGRSAVASESLLGELSVRTDQGRVRARRADLAPTRPTEAAAGMELLDDDGHALPWQDPRGAALWQALVDAHGTAEPPR